MRGVVAMQQGAVTVFFSVLLLIGAVTARAQQPASPQPSRSSPSSVQQPAADPASARRTMVAARMEDHESIALDGRLDEEIWKRAIPATDFVQQDPDNGRPATEQTEVRIVYSGEALYMGVTCFDSEPDRWIGYQRRRDEFLPADDRFMWNIDTFMDGRSAYFFEMNPSGLMGDALRNMGSSNRQWDGIWDAKVRRSEIGWTLEIEIPFRTLNFNPDADSWGINFQRTVRRKNEDSLWMGWLRNQGLQRMSNAGLLTGIRDVSQGRGFEVRPYALAATLSSPGRGASTVDNNFQGGVDFTYSPTPILRTNLTINTDFAQTEVDQRLTNLTRFPLFFPEKRDFFLDGSTFFDFGSFTITGGPAGFAGSDTTIIPLFTRRIGLSANGQPQKIDMGGKVTGQIGKQDVGVMYVRTGEEDGVLGEDFAVFRVKRRIFQQSNLGVLYTGRNPRHTSSPMLNTIGADFNLSTSTFLGRENLSFNGFYLRTTNPRNTGQNTAYGLALDFPNDPWSASLVYRDVEDHYDPAVGFTLRTGYRRINPSVTFAPRPRQHPLIRRFSFGAETDFYLDTADNRLLNRQFNVTLARVETHSIDYVEFRMFPKTYERLERNFPIASGITLPIGTEYTFTRYRVQAGTANRRVVAVTPALEWGRFYSGTRRQTSLNVTVRARPGLIMYLSGEWNRVRLPEGTFNTRLFRFIPEVQPSQWISLVNNFQYDSVSRVVGWQSRFRWIIKPGNDLYVVYTRNWLDDPTLNRFSTLDWRAASKFLYTYRF